MCDVRQKTVILIGFRENLQCAYYLLCAYLHGLGIIGHIMLSLVIKILCDKLCSVYCALSIPREAIVGPHHIMPNLAEHHTS